MSELEKLISVVFEQQNQIKELTKQNRELHLQYDAVGLNLGIARKRIESLGRDLKTWENK